MRWGWGVLHCIYPKSNGGHTDVKVENGQGQLRRNGPLIYSQLCPETNPSRSGMWMENRLGYRFSEVYTLADGKQGTYWGQGRRNWHHRLHARLFKEKNLRSWVPIDNGITTLGVGGSPYDLPQTVQN